MTRDPHAGLPDALIAFHTLDTLQTSPTSGERCVIALDPSAPDPSQFIAAAGRYARSLGAECIVLGVVQPAVLAGGAGPSPAEAQARASLEIATAELRRAGVSAAALLRAGALASTVADTAARHSAALIVLGAPRGRRRLGRWLARGRGDAIIRRAPCPTLRVGPTAVVPRPSSAAGAGARWAGGRHGVRHFDADVARAGPAVPHPLSARTIEVARIVGSVGRAGGVDDRFHDRRGGPRGAARYGRLLEVVERGGSLPPVDLYKLGSGYYLLDGHRRVAVARAVGQEWIDATVVEFVPVADGAARRGVSARRAFEHASGLTQVDAALPESYARLERLVRHFAVRQGTTDLREAGARWYARAFRPAWARLREARAHEHFPGHRTADIVARLAAPAGGAGAAAGAGAGSEGD
ncbi:MAG TPA: universal stress protein [Chloroflexota bacterium]|nr:universal stress protein [Chloroflexota bacterium]